MATNNTHSPETGYTSKERICLKCGRTFLSRGAFNRLCVHSSCTTKRRSKDRSKDVTTIPSDGHVMRRSVEGQS